jgi:mono/diheme cytochrome c family protein
MQFPTCSRRRMRGLFVALIVLTFVILLPLRGQSQDACSPEVLNARRDAFISVLTPPASATPEQITENLFRLGTALQAMALECGYAPDALEVTAMIDQVLAVTDMATIIAAQAVGDDVEAVLAALAETIGDPNNGQLLYNGLGDVLDGGVLACSGCHAGTVAPPVEGTWTRVDEIRLADPALAGYDVRRYLVESILLPNAYIAPGYSENLMPTNFGSRLDIQQLADVVAYMESQDQFLEPEAAN